MPLYIVQNSDYDTSYPPSYPVMQLNTANSIGTYSMSTIKDYSGLGNNLSTSATFNSSGMVCTATGSAATMPIAEAALFTFVIAINIPANPASAANIISTLTPASAPFTGLRIVQGTNGTGSILVATGIASPSGTSLVMGGITGGWTAFAVSVSDTTITYVRGNGATGSATITPSRSVSTSNIVINGAPTGSPLTDGITGTIGGLAVYNKAMNTTEMAQEINNMRVFMATKGVVIP
ncbi:hypothetical protein [Serratia quinivorans]|uniref:hypothetical protein n=1 Tax=Serratia quinivorans TaxID=137545 RepID=UPI003F9C52CF